MPGISSAVLVHAKGLGSAFHALIHLRMSASSSVTLRCADRRSFRFGSSANHRSTRFIHEALVGVKRGWRSSHLRTASALWVA